MNGIVKLISFVVRGFQVAPAELEGFLLGHPDVADVCVVGVPDDYSGEVPLAFVVLNAQAAERVRKSPAEGDVIKRALMKVCLQCHPHNAIGVLRLCHCYSTSKMARLHTSG